MGSASENMLDVLDEIMLLPSKEKVAAISGMLDASLTQATALLTPKDYRRFCILSAPAFELSRAIVNCRAEIPEEVLGKIMDMAAENIKTVVIKLHG